LRKSDYYKRHDRALAGLERKQIILQPDEYAMVMSEFNTHMSDEDRRHRIVTKPIGEYYYTIIKNGFDDYIVIGKRAISGESYGLWED
jgi:hypothetical protein